MAGMLPGVEYARKRRFHNCGINSQTNSSTSYMKDRNPKNIPMIGGVGGDDDDDDYEKLETLAREAKNRLDRRLNSHSRSTKQIKKEQKMRIMNSLCGGKGTIHSADKFGDR